MSDFVRDLLVARRSLGDATFVFPSFGKGGHIVGVTKSIKVLRAKTGLEFSLHDLRRTFITVAEALDISPYAIKALVNHALGQSVTEGYIKMDVERLRAPQQLVTDRLQTLCGITIPGGNVAALRG
jgi:integrase